MTTTEYNITTLESQFRANGYQTYDQFGPSVTALADGGFVVLYGNDNDVAVDNDFPLLTFYDADYNMVGTFEIPYTGSPTNMAGDPSITTLSNGNIVVTWDEENSADDVVGTILDSSGNVVKGEFVIETLDGQTAPVVTALTGGGFVVVTEGTSDIEIKIYDNDGNSLGSYQNVAAISGEFSEPDIIGLADGGFAVSYTAIEAGRNGGQSEVYVSVYDADGTLRNQDVLVGTFGTNNQSAMAALNNGNFAVVYTDDGWGSSGLTLHILDADGNATGIYSITNDYTRVDTDGVIVESDPVITVLENDYILVQWTQETTGSNRDILARLFDEDGNALSDVKSITSSGTDDFDSTIALLEGGKFVSAWTDTFSDDDGDRISASIKSVVRITTGDDTSEDLTLDLLRDSVTCNDGDDRVFARGGADTIQGGYGDDSLFGQSGQDYLIGAEGNDALFGGRGSDYLGGGYGLDQLAGNEGHDTAYGGLGSDWIGGGDGLDLLYGENGFDTLEGGADNDILYGGDGNDELIGNGGDDMMFGEAHDDVMLGLVGDDEMYLGSGDDVGLGGGGFDSIVGGNGNDTLDGGANADTLEGGFGDDDMDGGVGFDMMSGDEGNDTMNGGGSDDTLFGGDGLDNLSGDAGDDSIEGGVGSDLINGENGNDVLHGQQGFDEIYGGFGNDTIFAGSGNDYLYGGANADDLYGGDHNDTLSGGAGFDTMTGGDGSDVFVFEAGDGQDIITDFDGSEDMIDLSAYDFAGYAEVMTFATQQGSDVLFNFLNGDTLLVQGTTLGAFAPDDFIYS